MPHAWREAGRVPVSLVRRVCDCGCRRQKVQLIAGDGRILAFEIPIGAIAHAEKATTAIALGRELLAFWQRVRGAIAPK